MNVTVFIIKSDNGEFERAGKSTHTCSKPMIKYIHACIVLMNNMGGELAYTMQARVHDVMACVLYIIQ